MTARAAATDERSPWIKGIPAIAAYMGMNSDEVGTLLRSGELRGHQRRRGGTWRTSQKWIAAYFGDTE